MATWLRPRKNTYRLLGSSQALCRRVGKISGAVGEKVVPPADPSCLLVRDFGDQGVPSKEGREGIVVDVVVPVTVDSRVADEETFHVDVILVVQQLFSKGGAVVSTIRLSSDEEVVGFKIAEDVEPRLQKINPETHQ